MGKKMNRQHEVLRVPQGWSGQDRELIMQLERIHDDLYNRLVKAVTGQVFSVLGITPDDDGDVTLTKESITDLGIPGESYEPDVGEIKMFSGATAPDKWKICNGDVISRETYADLFAVLGSTYGGGDGSTTFAIPNFKGRSPLGVGESTATGHTNHTLGQMAGEEKHTLTVDELAYHNHSATTTGKYKKSCASGSNQNRVDSDGTSSTSGPYTTTIGYKGSNYSHNTMHPYTGVNFIIYTGVSDAA